MKVSKLKEFVDLMLCPEKGCASELELVAEESLLKCTGCQKKFNIHNSEEKNSGAPIIVFTEVSE